MDSPPPEPASPILSPLLSPSLSLDPKLQRFSALEPDYNAVPTYPVRPSYKAYHSQLRPASRVVVFDGSPDDAFQPASVPIYQTATFSQPSSTEFGAYDYTRSGNPTRTALERQVAMLENAHAAFAFCTGMAALNAVTRLLKAGDTILVGSDIYGGMHRLVSRVTAMYGVQVRYVPTWDLEQVELALQDTSVTLVHMETPSNPLMRITDIRALSMLLRPRGIILSVAATMMTPHLQQPIYHGADIVVHSMTKFFGGHSDTMGGVVCVANEDLAKRIAFFQNAEGTGLAPFDCWLFLRGIKTLAVRVTAAQHNAGHVAAFLLRHPLPKVVYYAGLEPTREEMLANTQVARDHKIHHGQSKGGGSVISFTTGSVPLSRKVIDHLRLFKLTVSFGSCNSLCEMPATLSHASIPAHERTLPDDLIRLSIGIEDVNDLLEDLQRAFALAMGTPLPEIDPTPASPMRGDTPNPSKIQRPPSTMHTSDRTVPEAPAVTPAALHRSPPRASGASSPADKALAEEVEALRRQVARHDKAKTLLTAFSAGFAMAAVASACFYRFVLARAR
jgi:cystathionine beta-lyase